MKYYLSSYRLGNNPEKLKGLVGDNKKVAIIVNAWDVSNDPERKNAGIQRESDEMKNLGLDPEVLDLREYFGKSEDVAKKMSELGLLWVTGGNTFILRKAFKESGLDEWLISQKENKDFVYAGYSAGVCVLSKELKGLEIVDNPNAVVKGYPKDTIWEGLGLIDFAFAPHYKSPHPESEAVDDLVDYYIREGVEYKALKDGEVIVIE